MNTNEIKNHWEHVYETKSPNQVSWTQDVPQISLDFIASFGVSKKARIIDIGGGDSKLVDCLLEQGYENITVLDISANALARAKHRLGDQAKQVQWVVCDVTEFNPDTTYDVWHDRAAFHFLTTQEQIEKYVEVARQCVDGYMIIGTFSEQGPKTCSGLDIKPYREDTLIHEVKNGFEKMGCVTQDHTTPFGTQQNFLFCSFKRVEKDKASEYITTIKS